MAKRGRAASRTHRKGGAGVVDVPKGSRPDGPVEGVYYIDTGDCELIAGPGQFHRLVAAHQRRDELPHRPGGSPVP